MKTKNQTAENSMVLTIINKGNGKTYHKILLSKEFNFGMFKKVLNLEKLSKGIDTKNFAFQFNGKEYLNRDLNAGKFWVNGFFAPLIILPNFTDEQKAMIKVIEKQLLKITVNFSLLDANYEREVVLNVFARKSIVNAIDELIDDKVYNKNVLETFKKYINE